MDLALQLVIEMNQWIWNRFKDDLKDATPEEVDWRPLPQANNISAASPRISPGNTFGHAPGADPQYPQSIPENAGPDGAVLPREPELSVIGKTKTAHARLPPPLTPVAFTGESKPVRKATGYEQQKAEAALSRVGFAGLCEPSFRPPFERISDPQIPLTRQN